MGFSPKPMAYLKMWVHLVWSTKNREPLLTKEVRQNLFAHIRENATSKNIYIDFINGYVDHVHCLISLKADQSIAQVAQLIKGESAFWINKQGITSKKLVWQSEYFAVSVSESVVPTVRDYIKNQELHHAKKTFTDEYEQFMNEFGFDKFNKEAT